MISAYEQYEYIYIHVYTIFNTRAVLNKLNPSQKRYDVRLLDSVTLPVNFLVFFFFLMSESLNYNVGVSRAARDIEIFFLIA